MYIKNPSEIENRSMEIIDEAIGSLDFSEKELLIAKRMIHTTGDVGYKDIIRFRNDAAEVGEKLLKQGARIFTDTRMAWSGINKKALEKSGSSLKCYIDDPRAAEYSKANSTTRSAAAIDIAVQDNIDIFVIGNAPTALFRLGELIKEGTISPKLIIGVPVGFVGAAESKEYIRGFMVPTISTEGTKGGSNVAASIVNALLYMAVGR